MAEDTLYRYRTITEYSILELINDDLVISSMDTINDPCDANIGFVNTDYHQALVSFLIMEKSFSDELSNNYFKDPKVQQFLEQIYDDHFSKFIMNFKKHILVGCFTPVNNNHVMWSHYSDYRRGFVVGYDRKTLETTFYNAYGNDVKSLVPVEYKNGVFDVTKEIIDAINSCTFIKDGGVNIDINKAQDIFNQSLLSKGNDFQKSLITKLPEWSYEKEVRSVMYDSTSNGNCHKVVGKCKPSCIIIGDKMHKKDKYLLLSVAFNKGLTVFELITLFKDGMFGLIPIPIQKSSVEYYLKHGEYDIKFNDFINL